MLIVENRESIINITLLEMDRRTLIFIDILMSEEHNSRKTLSNLPFDIYIHIMHYIYIYIYIRGGREHY